MGLARVLVGISFMAAGASAQRIVRGSASGLVLAVLAVVASIVLERGASHGRGLGCRRGVQLVVTLLQIASRIV